MYKSTLARPLVFSSCAPRLLIMLSYTSAQYIMCAEKPSPGFRTRVVYQHGASPKGPRTCGTADRANAERAVPGMLRRSINSIRRLVKKVPHTTSLVSTLLALLLGFFGFYLGQNLDPIDALYLTIVTISTVGYGDISPSDACIDDEGNDVSGSTACVGMRVFSVFYILLGCGYVFGHLSFFFRGALEKFSNLVKRQIDKFSSTTEAVDTTGDGKCDTKVTGKSVGLSGRSHDITGDGVADFVEPPMAVVYWAQELLPAILLVTLVQLLSALIFTVCIPELDVCHTGLEPQPAQGPRQVCCSRV